MSRHSGHAQITLLPAEAVFTAYWHRAPASAILADVQTRQRLIVIILVLLALIAPAAIYFRGRLESAAAASAQAASHEVASEQERGASLEREEQELQFALTTTRAALAEAETITLYNVANEFDADYSKFQGKAQIIGYPVRKQAVLEKGDATHLIDVLTSRDAYFPAGDGWACIFEPRHVLQLVGRRETTTIVICIHCGDVEFIVGKGSIGTRSVYPKTNNDLAQILDRQMNSADASAQKHGHLTRD